jgi:hypothetical protein
VIGGSTIAIFLNDFPGFLNRSREHSKSWTTIRILPSSATQPVLLFKVAGQRAILNRIPVIQLTSSVQNSVRLLPPGEFSSQRLK